MASQSGKFAAIPGKSSSGGSREGDGLCGRASRPPYPHSDPRQLLRHPWSRASIAVGRPSGRPTTRAGYVSSSTTHYASELALLPGQAVKPPTAHRTAVMVVIECTLETLRHVINFLDPGLDQRLAGLERADPAAADQHHRGRTTGSAEYRLPYLGDEVRIHLPVRFVDPGDVNGARRVADEQGFHIGAHVHEQGIRGRVQE